MLSRFSLLSLVILVILVGLAAKIFLDGLPFELLFPRRARLLRLVEPRRRLFPILLRLGFAALLRRCQISTAKSGTTISTMKPYGLTKNACSPASASLCPTTLPTSADTGTGTGSAAGDASPFVRTYHSPSSI